jgi:hypothetical protein
MKPIARWIAVVLPSSIGPRNPNISLLWTWSEKLSSAAIRAPVKRLYSLLMFSNSRAKGIQDTFYSQTGKTSLAQPKFPLSYRTVDK